MSTVQQITSTIIDTITATILNGQTTSDIIDTFGATMVQLELPAAFDGTALTFLTSSDNVTFRQYMNIENVPVTIICTQDRHYGLAAQDFFPVRYIKIISNASETADRIIRLIPKAI